MKGIPSTIPPSIVFQLAIYSAALAKANACYIRYPQARISLTRSMRGYVKRRKIAPPHIVTRFTEALNRVSRSVGVDAEVETCALREARMFVPYIVQAESNPIIP